MLLFLGHHSFEKSSIFYISVDKILQFQHQQKSPKKFGWSFRNKSCVKLPPPTSCGPGKGRRQLIEDEDEYLVNKGWFFFENEDLHSTLMIKKMPMMTYHDFINQGLDEDDVDCDDDANDDKLRWEVVMALIEERDKLTHFRSNESAFQVQKLQLYYIYCCSQLLPRNLKFCIQWLKWRQNECAIIFLCLPLTSRGSDRNVFGILFPRQKFAQGNLNCIFQMLAFFCNIWKHFNGVLIIISFSQRVYLQSDKFLKILYFYFWIFLDISYVFFHNIFCTGEFKPYLWTCSLLLKRTTLEYF